MKKFHQYMMILAASALTACSSMDLSDAEAYAEDYPADFNARTYMDLHPTLYALQVHDYVAMHNKEVEKSMTPEAYAALVAADNATFDDSAQLALFVHPYYGALTEAQWATASNSQKKWIGGFNLVDAPNDLAALEEYRLNGVNLEAIGLQYVMFGRTHGWAYRACTDVESAGAVAAGELLTYPVQFLVCRDAAGVDHIIP